jgi:outer membrane protein TolC
VAELDREILAADLRVELRHREAVELPAVPVALSAGNRLPAVRLREQQLSLQERKFKAGTVTKFNVLTADVELANTMPQLIRARNNKRIAEVQLARILALDYPLEQPDDWSPPVEVVGELPYQPAAVNLETSLINAVNNRPDLRATKDELRVQQELIKAAKADAFIPKIVGSGGYDVIQDQTSSSFTKSLQGPVANISGTWTLFDGMQTTGRLEQLKAQYAAAEVAVGLAILVAIFRMKKTTSAEDFAALKF